MLKILISTCIFDTLAGTNALNIPAKA